MITVKFASHRLLIVSQSKHSRLALEAQSLSTYWGAVNAVARLSLNDTPLSAIS